ncbi:hypothetical protein CEXT_324151 [Caerostris extrusa]|uniref:Uncharacterized protein n=1 Tax=Caerostris extrusa TaxID=172846 RepID=A0AAV4XQA3_CAEEX|nr:hypothetical protein CEXT_324151 [Caerostris extrusa]
MTRLPGVGCCGLNNIAVCVNRDYKTMSSAYSEHWFKEILAFDFVGYADTFLEDTLFLTCQIAWWNPHRASELEG